jgi:hypothetical protein
MKISAGTRLMPGTQMEHRWNTDVDMVYTPAPSSQMKMITVHTPASLLHSCHPESETATRQLTQSRWTPLLPDGHPSSQAF